jgi:hypothetical protein
MWFSYLFHTIYVVPCLRTSHQLGFFSIDSQSKFLPKRKVHRLECTLAYVN